MLNSGSLHSVFSYCLGESCHKKGRRFLCGLPFGFRHRVASWLLTRAVLDHLFDLLLHRFEVEGSRVLHRRIVNGRQR